MSSAADTKDTPRAIVGSPYPKIQIPDGLTFYEFLRTNAASQDPERGCWGTRTAFECGTTGRSYAHDEVYGTSTSFAVALLQLKGLSAGDVIAVALPNVPEYASVLFGAWQAGLVATPVNPGYTSGEMGRQLKDASAKVVVTTLELVPVLREAAGTNGMDLAFIVIGEGSSMEAYEPGVLSYFEMVKSHSRVQDLDLELLRSRREAVDPRITPCLLPYSSGTTGGPKGVELSHRNLIAISLQVRTATATASLPQEEQQRFIGLLPMFHMAGLASYIGLGMLVNAHVLALPKFHPVTFLAAVRAHKPTTLHLVPPLLKHIAESDEYTRGGEELAAVRSVIVGAAPVHPGVIKAFVEKVGHHELVVQQIYGMTEAGVCHMMPPSPVHLGICTRWGSAGLPVSNTSTKIVDVTTGAAVTARGSGATGEICVKGPQVMMGYHQKPDATEATLDNEGWLRTGDIGYVDEEGYLFIVDRLKEFIKVKGFQVSPSELEGVLLECDGVEDVAVFGVPEEGGGRWGELPCAVIVRKDTERGRALLEEDVHGYLRSKVADFKALRGGILFVDSIPKGGSGKTLRRAVLAQWNEARKCSE